MAAALITERSPGCFGFAHGVVRETLTEGMSGSAPVAARPGRLPPDDGPPAG